MTLPASGTGPATVTLVARVTDVQKEDLKRAIVNELRLKGGRIGLGSLFSGRALFQPAWLRIIAGNGTFKSDTAMVIAALSQPCFADTFEIQGADAAAPMVVLRHANTAVGGAALSGGGAAGSAAGGGSSSAGAASASVSTAPLLRPAAGAARPGPVVTVAAVMGGTVGTIPQRTRLIAKIVHAKPNIRRRFSELWGRNSAQEAGGGLQLRKPMWLAAAKLSESAERREMLSWPSFHAQFVASSSHRNNGDSFTTKERFGTITATASRGRSPIMCILMDSLKIGGKAEKVFLAPIKMKNGKSKWKVHDRVAFYCIAKPQVSLFY